MQLNQASTGPLSSVDPLPKSLPIGKRYKIYTSGYYNYIDYPFIHLTVGGIHRWPEEAAKGSP